MSGFIFPTLGGALIGISVSLMLYLNGRVTGVSGIINGVFNLKAGEKAWRFAFIFGLLVGGFILETFWPQSLVSAVPRNVVTLIAAGLLVGFGTVMGGGCTSGHGICGLSRLSRRSILATIVFMTFGILTATLFRLITEGA